MTFAWFAGGSPDEKYPGKPGKATIYHRRLFLSTAAANIGAVDKTLN
jgi:hypothetical protein